MPGLTRYVEWMSRGRRTGRVVYATKERNVPKPLPGAEWQRDARFNAAEELLRDPELKVAIKAALEKGAEVVHFSEKPRQTEGEEMSERTAVQAAPELPDITPLDNVELPTRINNALAAAGLGTVGEVREASDEMLVSLPNLGTRSVAHLRETLGLPSTDGVRPPGKKPA
jgi:hypothetical protein